MHLLAARVIVAQVTQESRIGKPGLISAERRAPGNAGVCTIVRGDQGNIPTMRIHAPLGKPFPNLAEEGLQHRACASANNHYIRLK